MEPDPVAQALPREFFARDTETVARDLLGVWLMRATPEGVSGGPIVETEAYLGPDDRASHARAGRTKRTAPMFGQVGHAYVYLVYGMHNCVNVVAYDAHEVLAGAVLIRAIQPRLGATAADARSCAGPAKLCRALSITREQDGLDLTTSGDLWLAPGDRISDTDVKVGARIGVDYAGDGWKDRPLRFWIAANTSVSRQR